MSPPPSPTSDDDQPQPTPSPPLPSAPSKPALDQAQDALVDAPAVENAPHDAETDSTPERDALGNMIHWVQILSEMLATAEQAVLETTLTVTKSNPQLAIANKEML
ncbi:hypothetical protein EXIGLDRAFT_760378 [Exidia glandulosa HHB12029]|uniref:Uncharacterized protein n=1 Tax=Exidia glandulosa HHB12029 TaxID=1314781 RepID=A0A165P7N6_EXIGL|nr:hypothetical protein EXIGLDRAFT_760378 [Exidia glandulosa HHB12029]